MMPAGPSRAQVLAIVQIAGARISQLSPGSFPRPIESRFEDAGQVARLALHGAELPRALLGIVARLARNAPAGLRGHPAPPPHKLVSGILDYWHDCPPFK